MMYRCWFCVFIDCMFSLPLSPDLTLTVASVTAALESVGDLYWLALVTGLVCHCLCEM